MRDAFIFVRAHPAAGAFGVGDVYFASAA